MRQRPKRERTEHRTFADENYEGLENYDELDSDDDFVDPTPAGRRSRQRARAGGGGAGGGSQKRSRTADQRPASRRRRGDDFFDDEAAAGAVEDQSDASEGLSGEEASEDRDISDSSADDGSDDGGAGDEDYDVDGGRGRGSQRRTGAAERRIRGRGRGRGRGGAPASPGGRGRGRGRGAAAGGGGGSGGGAAGESDSEVIIIGSDSDEDGGGAWGMQAARGERRGGRGRGCGAGGSAATTTRDPRPSTADDRGRGRGSRGGRGRGSRPLGLGLDGEDDADAPDAGAPPTQAQRRQYVVPAMPLQINQEELQKMRMLIRRYKDEWEAAKEKCDVWEELSGPDRDLLAGSVLRYMLFSARAKPGQPVARAKLKDAVKEALKTHRHFKKLGSVWLPWARHKALSSLGYDIAEVVRPRGGGAAADPAAGGAASAAADGGGEGAQYYVLRTALPTALRCEFVDGSEGNRPEDSFKMAVMALIMQNGGRMNEDELHRYVTLLGFPADRGQPHPILGFFDDLVKKLGEQRYLAQDKQAQADGSTTINLMWGEAAASEFTRAQLKATLEPLFQQLTENQQEEEEQEVEDAEVEDGEGAAAVAGTGRAG